MPEAPVLRGDVRLFFLEGGAGPEANVTYEGSAKVTRPTQSFGDITNQYEPSPYRRRQYRVIAKTHGAETPPEMPITNIYKMALSKWLRLGKQKCDHDLQAHMGACEVPTNYNGGYDKILILEKGSIRSWGLDGDLSSLTPDDEGISNEEVPFVGELLYEHTRFTNFARIGSATFVRPLVDGVIADNVSCGGDCGTPSTGCEHIAWLSSATVGSPGAAPTVYYTADGGSTIGSSVVASLASSENAEAIAWDGTYVFVVSSADEGIHYTAHADLEAGTATWTQITTGIVAAHGPKAVYVAGPSDIFIAGLGGYIYKSTNIVDGVTVLESGSATTEDLNSIHGIDDLHVVAVGDNNAVVYTSDGQTFSSLTGPAAAVDLLKVWMVTADIFWVAAADGNLYYTKNRGTTWSTRNFSGSGSGTTQSIVFVTRSIGFMSHTTAANVGRLFKTIDGGRTWQILPERVGGATVPSHRSAVAILPCDQNTFFTAGSDSAGTAGFVVKAS